MSFKKEFQHLKISLKDIKSATNDFGGINYIGEGGFGKVYIGELLLPKGPTKVAVKRLNTARGQGAPEFWKEVMLLSQYKHENLVSLVGFCDEDGESILVYEYLCNKSLDFHLSSPNLSWNQRLRICIGAARGLQYLHDPHGTHQRVLHRDIKSANILLDENWNAKISDFGLSKLGPANQLYTFLVSGAVGTLGYLDPVYLRTGELTKECDVYSFGVVLFEVLCGKLCMQIYDGETKLLTAVARKCYDEKKLDTIIDPTVKKEISPGCMERFSTISYQCIMIDHKTRPSMDKIVEELEIALQYQVEYEFEEKKKLKQQLALESCLDDYWDTKLPPDWELITKTFKIPRTIYTDKKKLVSCLQDGLPLGKDDKFFWINDAGKKCVLLSATKFLDCVQSIDPRWAFQKDLRFSRVAEYDRSTYYDVINFQINVSLLSLGTMYAANLVFKYRLRPNEVPKHLKLMKIRWKMDGMSVSSMHFAELARDGWYKIKMWHFVNHGPNSDFDIVLQELRYIEGHVYSDLLIQAIEFQPVEMVQHEKDFDHDDDVHWEKKLPNHYEDYIQNLEKPLHYTSKKELYLLFCAGFFGSNGMWFSLCKSTGGICSMVPCTKFLPNEDDKILEDSCALDMLSLSESRFAKVIELTDAPCFRFKCSLSSAMFSSMDYECYLVFRYKDSHLHPDDNTYEMCYNLDGIYDDKFYGRLYSPVNGRVVNIPTIKLKNDSGLHENLKDLRSH